jgi:hypothetical protein
MNAKDWIRLPFRFLFRLAVVLAMLAYVSLGTLAAAALYKKHTYRGQDLEALNAVITNAAEEGHMLTVTTWVNSRPLEETDKLIAALVPKSALLEPGTFFELFRRELRRGNTEEALFWLQLGKYRLRFDAMRCKNAEEAAAKFDILVNRLPSKEIDAFLKDNPGALKKSLQRVLDFDEKYRAADDPAMICRAVGPGAPADTEDWGAIRSALREQTEEFINASR